MKKKYICPETLSIVLTSQQVLATSSLDIKQKNAEQWSNRNDSWSAGNWSDDACGDEE